MTDKRFTIGDRALQEVYGGCIPAILDGGIPCTQSQVLKLLNELHEENEQLKYNLYDHMVDLNNSTGKCSALEIENEQLNQQIKELKAYNNWLISVLEDSGAIVEIKKR